MQIKKKQMRLSNETRFQKRWLGKESKLVIHIIETLAAAAKDNILSARLNASVAESIKTV